MALMRFGRVASVAVVAAVGFVVGVPVSAGAAVVSGGGGVSPGAGCRLSQAVTTFHFVINGTRSVTDLSHQVQPGDRVQAFFTVNAGCRVPMVLASYTSATDHGASAADLTLFGVGFGTFGAGSASLGPVTVPGCDFRVHFAVDSDQPPPLHPGPTPPAQFFSISSAAGGGGGCVSSPAVSAAAVCGSAGGVKVSLSNTGFRTDTLTVTRANRTGFSDTVVVAQGQQVSRTYPLEEDRSDTFAVADDQLTPFRWSQPVTVNCLAPKASFSVACGSDGQPALTVAVTNEGFRTEHFVLSADRSKPTGIEVAANSSTTATVSYANGATPTFKLTEDFEAFSQTYTPASALQCSAAPPTTTPATLQSQFTMPPLPAVNLPATLPATGAHTTIWLAWAALLTLTGSGLLLALNRTRTSALPETGQPGA